MTTSLKLLPVNLYGRKEKFQDNSAEIVEVVS